MIGVSNTWLGRFLLPPTDKRYVRPSPEIIAHIEKITESAVTAADWPPVSVAETTEAAQ